ncbi:MAG: YadA-like family protein, partial [Phascolarctobacterium sp.]|nr:YadA-like family protein [Phascolarctobacterium sp.]
ADNNGFGVAQGGSTLAVTNDGVGLSKTTEDGVKSAVAVTDGGVGITSGEAALVVGASGTAIKGGLNMMNEKITGVAAGKISETSTDAVNGSQLKHVQDQVDAIDGRVTTIESDITEIKGDINNINENIESLDNRVTQVEAIAGKHTTVTTAESEKNLTISKGTNDAGGKEYSITINRDMDLDSVTTGNTVMSNDGISFKDSDTKLTSSGLTVGDTIVDGDGISIKTEEGKETYITKDGINANDKKITNVADGDVSKDSTDAVNGSQLHATNEYISNVANQVADNSSRINKLGRRVDKVGAGSAALAALHPLDFDPDDKLTFSAGVGNYHGQNAAAIGAFYRPTEKIMVSVGGTVGNDENMVNAGISFALDRTNNVSNSRTAMAREIVDLRAQVANLTALVNKLISDKTGADPAAMFPDVPANHWAYEYINGLAMQGIIEGYPDGTFQGDATMTRYEFATMLFKAMEKGAVLSDRLREEFKNELGRIRVDRIKGDDNDAGKIERVRVNEGADRDDYGTKLQAQG